MSVHLNNLQLHLCLYLCLLAVTISLKSFSSHTHECYTLQCSALFIVAFRMKMKTNEMGGWHEQGEGWRLRRAAAFIFSASHVIFIVNKTYLALLSEQGLARGASIHRERRLVWEGSGGEQGVKAGEIRGGWRKGRGKEKMKESSRSMFG